MFAGVLHLVFLGRNPFASTLGAGAGGASVRPGCWARLGGPRGHEMEPKKRSKCQDMVPAEGTETLTALEGHSRQGTKTPG